MILTGVGVSVLEQTVIVLYGPISGHADPATERRQLDALPYARRLELERRSAPERRASLAGMSLALQCIEHLVGVRPKLGQFRFPQDGKPHLPGGPHFSLSHTGEFAACAASLDLELGLDLEMLTNGQPRTHAMIDLRVDSGIGPGDLACRAAMPMSHVNSGAAADAAADSAAQLNERLRRWTATEATLKAAGCGLRHAREVLLATDLRSSQLQGRRYFLREVAIASGVIAHLAASVPLDGIRLAIDRAEPPPPEP